MATRKKNNWWYVDFRFDNQRFRKKSPENSRKGAQAYELLLRQRLARGEPLEPEAARAMPIFTAWSQHWFDTYVRANNKPSEQHSKTCILRAHLRPFFGRLPIDQIAHPDVEQFKAEQRVRGLKAKSINNQLTVLRKCLRYAQDAGLLPTLPKIQLLKSMRPPIDFLTARESRQLLLDTSEPMWHSMVLTALHTGMRRGELFALDWCDLDFDSGLITVHRSRVMGITESTKGYSVRYIPMTRELRAVLAPRRRPEGLVFERPGGLPLTDETAEYALARICGRTGIRHIGWHTLRHSFGTQLAARKVRPDVIQRLMGHKDIKTTLMYIHLTEQDLKTAMLEFEGGQQPAIDYSGPYMVTEKKQETALVGGL